MNKKELYKKVTEELKSEEVKEVRGRVVETVNGSIVSFSRTKVPVSQMLKKIKQPLKKPFLRGLKEQRRRGEDIKEGDKKMYCYLIDRAYKIAELYKELEKTEDYDLMSINLEVLKKEYQKIKEEIKKY